MKDKKKWKFVTSLGIITFTKPTKWDKYSTNIEYEGAVDMLQYAIEHYYIPECGNINSIECSPQILYYALCSTDIDFYVDQEKPRLEPIWGGGVITDSYPDESIDEYFERKRREWLKENPYKELDYAFSTMCEVQGKERLVEIHFRDCAWREEGCREIVLPAGQSDADNFPKNEYGESEVMPTQDGKDVPTSISVAGFLLCTPERAYREIVLGNKGKMIVGEPPIDYKPIEEKQQLESLYKNESLLNF